MLAVMLVLTDPFFTSTDWSYYYRQTKPELRVVGSDRWTFNLSRTMDECFAHVKKNGEEVVKMEGWGGQVCYKRCWFPTPWPVFLVGNHSAMGHGQQIDYYAIQDGKAKLLISVMGESGGPVFRDFDNDGVMEWVFDDDDWYTYYGEGPTRYFVYRVNSSGGLDHWRTLANPSRTRLQTPFFDWFPVLREDR